MHACMHTCIYMHTYMHAYIHICMCVCMYVCYIHTFSERETGTHTHTHTQTHAAHTNVHVCIYVCMCVVFKHILQRSERCVCVCVCMSARCAFPAVARDRGRSGLVGVPLGHDLDPCRRGAPITYLMLRSPYMSLSSLPATYSPHPSMFSCSFLLHGMLHALKHHSYLCSSCIVVVRQYDRSLANHAGSERYQRPCCAA